MLRKIKRRGNPQYKNGFIGYLYQPLKSLPLPLIFRVTSADATYSSDFEIYEELMDKYYFENSFVAVSSGLYSGFCLVSALGR